MFSFSFLSTRPRGVFDPHSFGRRSGYRGRTGCDTLPGWVFVIVQQAPGGRPAQGLHKATSCTIVSFNAHDPPVRESQRTDFRGARGAKTEFSELLGLARARHCSFTRVETVQGFQYGGVVGCRRDGQTWSGLSQKLARWLAGRWALDAGLTPSTSTVPVLYGAYHSTCTLLFAKGQASVHQDLRPIPCWVRVSAEFIW